MKVTWILADGGEMTADVAEGVNLMEAAVAQNVPGVIGECGGCLSCATCHVFVDDAWVAKTGSADDFEDAMLDVAETTRTDKSRLSCQIEMRPDLDGIRVTVPQ